MQGLQVELFDGLSETHGWPLHRLGDRLCILEVVLLPVGSARPVKAALRGVA
jgi:CRISPR/Cas system-associated protein Cas5 (RAMP superfamily)